MEARHILYRERDSTHISRFTTGLHHHNVAQSKDSETRAVEHDSSATVVMRTITLSFRFSRHGDAA
jgi:hypothetical protein